MSIRICCSHCYSQKFLHFNLNNDNVILWYKIYTINARLLTQFFKRDKETWKTWKNYVVWALMPPKWKKIAIQWEITLDLNERFCLNKPNCLLRTKMGVRIHTFNGFHLKTQGWSTCPLPNVFIMTYECWKSASRDPQRFLFESNSPLLQISSPDFHPCNKNFYGKTNLMLWTMHE